jgi:hypothetical protein
MGLVITIGGLRFIVIDEMKGTEMFRRTLMIATLIGLGFLPEWSLANRTNLTRQEIRSLPITERPNRVGHFYGNTVRRQHSRRGR